jgi:uncharacterized tellurite resistance protein B-like protein
MSFWKIINNLNQDVFMNIYNANLRIINDKTDNDDCKVDHNDYQLILSLTAIGISMAYADGEIDVDELISINEFTSKLFETPLPIHIIEKIDFLNKNPPSFKETLSMARQLPKNGQKKCLELMEIVALADGVMTSQEQRYLDSFKNVLI